MIAQIHVAVFYLLLALSLTLVIAGFVLRLQNHSDLFCGDDQVCIAELQFTGETSSSFDEVMEQTYLDLASYLGYLAVAVAITLIMFPQTSTGYQIPYFYINLIWFYVLAVCVLGLCLAALTNILQYYSEMHEVSLELYDQKGVAKHRLMVFYNKAPYPLALNMVALAIAIVMAPMMRK